MRTFIPQKDLYDNVQYFIHHTPKLEIAQVSISKGMDILWCTYTAIKMDKLSSMSSIICGLQESQVP